MTHRQQFGVLALVCILVAAMASGPNGGDDSPAGTADAPVTTVRPPPPIVASRAPAQTPRSARVARVGNTWAPLFAVAPNPNACGAFDVSLRLERETAATYMGQPACEQAVCERPGNRPIRNCTPLSPGYQTSFKNARVQDVVIKCDRAAVRFSNGAVVELGVGTDPMIDKIGGNAGRGFFH